MHFNWKRVAVRKYYGISGRKSRSRFKTTYRLIPLIGRDTYSLAIGSGAFSLTGSNVGLKRGYPIVAGSVSYTLTGSNVAITTQHKLSVASGVFSLSGSSVGLKRGYPILVGSGTFSLTGNDVSLRHIWMEPIDSGTYSLTGSTVGLKRGYPINVQSGSYTITGSDVNLKYGHKIPVGSGVFSLSGSNVSLVHGKPLSIDSGSFSITGAAVGLTHTSKIPVGSGSYAILGAEVDLRYSAGQPRLAIGAGNFSLDGSSVNLSLAHKIAVGIGNYSLTGTSVALRTAKKLPIGTGTYSFSGSNVGFRRGHPLIIGSGTYGYVGAGQLRESLGVYYRFQNDLTDSSGNAKDQTSIADSPAYGAGVIGNGLVSDGGFVQLSRLNDLIVSGAITTTQFTSSWWMTPKLFASFSWSLSNQLNGIGCTITGVSGTDIECNFFVGNQNSITVTTPADVSTHFAFSISASGIGTLYINALPVIVLSLTSVETWPAADFQTFDMVITDGSLTPSQLVDEFGIWVNRALTQSEITVLRSNGNGYDPTQTTPVTLRWGHAGTINSGAYILTGSSVTLTYTPLHLPGGLVCATVYITPSVSADLVITHSVDGDCQLERC